MLHLACAEVMKERPPFFVFSKIFGDAFGHQNVTGIPAAHDPLRSVQTSTGEIGAFIHIDDTAHRPTMHSHSQRQMQLRSATHLNRALHRRFRTRVKNQCDAIARWNFDQPISRFSFSKFVRRANRLTQLVHCGALLIHRKLRITNDVDEQNMGDLEFDLFLDLSRHAYFGTGQAASFWKRGSFRSGSNIGSSRSNAGVSGTPEITLLLYGIESSFCKAPTARSR